MGEEMSLVELLSMLKKRISLIFNMVLVGLVIAAFYTFFIAIPKYSATSQLLVNRTQDTEVIQRADIDTNVQLINTYSDIIENAIILDSVIEELNLAQSVNQMKDKINVTTSENSQVFTLEVIDENPYIAAEIANTTSIVFKENLDSIMNVDNVSIISQASADLNPVSPNNTLNLIIGVMLGGIVGLGIAMLLEFLDTSVKDEKFIVEQLGWTNLGRISEMDAEELKSDGRNAVLSKKLESRSARSRV